MLVDSHCHLDHLDLTPHGGSLHALLNAARACGVHGFLSVGVDLESSRHLLDVVQAHPDVVMSVGSHPLQSTPQPLPEVAELLELGRSNKVVAIGETGLDYHYSPDTARWQRESFVRHACAASELAKPLIVHTRAARAETLDILRRHANSGVGGVLHCFTESWAMAKAALDLDFYISFSGILTFGNADDLRAVAKKIPLDRLLVETDSPWLAPKPYRGRKNEPRYVVEVAQALAEVRGLTLPELARATTANFERLFGQLPRTRADTNEKTERQEDLYE